MLSIVLPQSVGRFIAENLFEMSFLEDELSGLNEDEARSGSNFIFCLHNNLMYYSNNISLFLLCLFYLRKYDVGNIPIASFIPGSFL